MLGNNSDQNNVNKGASAINDALTMTKNTVYVDENTDLKSEIKELSAIDFYSSQFEQDPLINGHVRKSGTKGKIKKFYKGFYFCSYYEWIMIEKIRYSIVKNFIKSPKIMIGGFNDFVSITYPHISKHIF